MVTHRGPSVVLALALSACSPGTEPARHTVNEYRADATLRQATLKVCASDQGALGGTPDCINARAAASLGGTGGSLRDLPPLNLDPSKNPLQGRPSGSEADRSDPRSSPSH